MERTGSAAAQGLGGPPEAPAGPAHPLPFMVPSGEATVGSMGSDSKTELRARYMETVPNSSAGLEKAREGGVGHTDPEISARGDRPRGTRLWPPAAPGVRAVTDAHLRAPAADLRISEGSPWPSAVPYVRWTLGASQRGGN